MRSKSDSWYVDFLSPQQELIKTGNFLLYYTSNIPISSLIYLSSVFKIWRKEYKLFQDLRIFADLADSALGYRGIFEGWKVGCITYLKIYIKIRVNTMDWDYNGKWASVWFERQSTFFHRFCDFRGIGMTFIFSGT